MASLGVNIDHIATLREQRKGMYPNLIDACTIIEQADADQITAHLREDRRHINDKDIQNIKSWNKLPLNMEMSINQEIVNIACNVKPVWCCLVPEKRQELTTEGGLDVLTLIEKLKSVCNQLKENSIKISLFLDPDIKQIEASSDLPVDAIEIHTGTFCNQIDQNKRQKEIEKIKKAGVQILKQNLAFHAGHGLNKPLLQELSSHIPEIKEYNIGHALICDAIFDGLFKTVSDYKKIIS
ncbi:pyridoxine 5'-phosphate synthase [Candidatus Margulisiibacteriota bacterium]